MAREVVIVGGGIAGLACAWHAAERGHAVTVVERGADPAHDCCSLGNAGYVCPSHLIPLASPGLLRLGLRMLWRQGGPFGIRWGLDPGLWAWCLCFARCATPAHTARCAPLLRQLGVASLGVYEDWSSRAAGAFELHRRGLLLLCAAQSTLDHEAELVEMLHTALRIEGPVAIRYPRGAGVGTPLPARPRPVELGQAQVLESGYSGVPGAWRNPDTGYQYSVVPQPAYQTAQGPCREYTVDSVIGGRMEKVHGTACRQADGSWRAVN